MLAISLSAALWVCAASVVSVDGALEALHGGATELDVPTSVGRQAAARIAPELADEQLLRNLARIARSGRAEPELVAALVALLRGKGPLFVAALGELAAAEPAAIVALDAEPLPEQVVAELLRLAGTSDEQAVVLGAVALLPPRVPPATLVELAQQWASSRHTQPQARRLLQELPRTKAPPACLTALLEADLPALAPELATAARALVAHSAAAADLALDAAERGDVARGLVLASLAGVRLEDDARRGRALAVLERLLTEAEKPAPPELVAAAITASAELLFPKLVPLLPRLAAAGAPRVRVAALSAMARVCYRDAQTIDLLMGTIDDPDDAVARAAYEALLAKSGQELPMRADAWLLWRAHANLPEAAPRDDEARLEQERRLRARVAERGPTPERRPRPRRERPEGPPPSAPLPLSSGGVAVAVAAPEAASTPGRPVVAARPDATATTPAATRSDPSLAAPSRMRSVALLLAPLLHYLWVGLVVVAAVAALVFARLRLAPARLPSAEPAAPEPAAGAAPARSTTSRLARLSQSETARAPTGHDLAQIKDASQRFEDGLASLMAASPPAGHAPVYDVQPATDSVGHLVFRAAAEAKAASPSPSGDPHTVPAGQLFGDSASLAEPLDPHTVPAGQLFGDSTSFIDAPPPPLDPKTVPVGELFGDSSSVVDAPAPPAPSAPLDPRTVPAAQLFGDSSSFIDLSLPAPAVRPGARDPLVAGALLFGPAAVRAEAPGELSPLPTAPVPLEPQPLPVPPAPRPGSGLFPAPGAATHLTMAHVLALTALWKKLGQPVTPEDVATWDRSRELLQPVVSASPVGVEALALLDRARQVVAQGRPMTPAAERMWADLLGQLFRLVARGHATV